MVVAAEGPGMIQVAKVPEVTAVLRR